MAKLYIFGIGGTGSRVIKSLTMLLASGVKLNNGFDTVVPIIIDPDVANGDLNRTSDILKKYQNVQSNIDKPVGFFNTKISTLTQLTNGNVQSLSDNFKFNIDGSGKEFGESIGYNGLDAENKAFVDLLFSKENIEADLTVGFKGNPNIGSVVLNKIVDSQEYQDFSGSFNEGDAIFIISSIFGGTGASGFPLLLKNLRDETKGGNSTTISQSKIGAITYLPYFKVSSSVGEEKAIDSTTFYGKAKAALSYYEHSIFNNDKANLNNFYLLGDNANNNVPYAEGMQDQKNKAHFLELAGALSIIDFIDNIKGDSNSTIIKEFGIEKESSKIDFEELGKGSKDLLRLPLSKFYLFNKFLEKSKQKLIDNKGEFNNKIGDYIFSSDFYRDDFSKLMISFDEWMKEMDGNDVAFSPFNINQDHENLLDFIKGKKIESTFFSNKSKGDIIIKEVNKVAKTGNFINEDKESQFIKIFDEVLENQVKKIIE